MNCRAMECRRTKETNEQRNKEMDRKQYPVPNSIGDGVKVSMQQLLELSQPAVAHTLSGSIVNVYLI